MVTPDFILSLRAKIGHEQLWLPGVSLVVLDDADRALLGRRSDNGMWAVVSGIPEPGEQPGEAALRECVEETRVRPRILGVAQVRAEEPFAFANGDRAVFMDICFVARADASQVATAGVGDEESTAVGGFGQDPLPEPQPSHTRPRQAAPQDWVGDRVAPLD